MNEKQDWNMPIRVCWRGKCIGYVDTYDDAIDMLDEYKKRVVEPFQWKPVYVDISIKLPSWIGKKLKAWGWIR